MEKRNLQIDTNFLNDDPETDIGLVTHSRLTPQKLQSAFSLEKILTNYMIRNFISSWNTLKNLVISKENGLVKNTIRKIKQNQNQGLTLDVVEKERTSGRNSLTKKEKHELQGYMEESDPEIALSRANLLQQIVEKLSYKKRTYTSREQIETEMMKKMSRLEKMICDMHEDKYSQKEPDLNSNYTEIIAGEIKDIKNEIKQLKFSHSQMLMKNQEEFYHPLQSSRTYQTYQSYQPQSKPHPHPLQAPPLPIQRPPVRVVRKNPSPMVVHRKPSPVIIHRQPSPIVHKVPVYHSHQVVQNQKPPVLRQVNQESSMNGLTGIPAHSVIKEVPSPEIQNSEGKLKVQSYPREIKYIEAEETSGCCSGWFW